MKLVEASPGGFALINVGRCCFYFLVAYSSRSLENSALDCKLRNSGSRLASCTE